MNTLVLSSGLGTRLRPITLNTPKPIVEILNLPLVCFSIYPAIECTDSFVFNLSYSASKVEAKLLDIDVKKKVILEGKKPLGITKGILNAKHLLTDDFFVINADTLFLPEDQNFLKKCLKFHKLKKSIATFVVTEFKSGHLKFSLDKNNNILSMNEKEGFHFIGYYILNKKIFKFFDPKKHLFKCVLEAAKNFPVKCFFQKGLWFETGNIVDLSKTRNSLKNFNSAYLSSLIEYYS